MNFIPLQKKRSRWKTAAYVVTALLITSALIRVFILDSFTVQGNSMSPTIQDGEYIFVYKGAYRGKDPARGDIVVGNFREMLGTKVVKRVVGMPREWVYINGNSIRLEDVSEAGKITYEGELYSSDLSARVKEPEVLEYRLDPHEYYLIGDNGMSSMDSRELGPVDVYRIDGRVFLKFRLSNFSYQWF